MNSLLKLGSAVLLIVTANASALAQQDQEQASSATTECQLKNGIDINSFATDITKEFNAQKANLPDLIQIGTAYSVSAKNDGKTKYNYYQEAFVRAQKNEVLSLPGFPFLGIRLRKQSDAIYLCARSEELIVYMMEGYKLNHNQKGLFSKEPRLTIQPVEIVIVGAGEVPDLIDGIVRKIPFIGDWWLTRSIARLPTGLLRAFQDVITQTVATFAGVGGIEKIRITNEFLELSAQVDLEDSTHAGISKRFYWKEMKELKEKAATETKSDDNRQKN